MVPATIDASRSACARSTASLALARTSRRAPMTTASRSGVASGRAGRAPSAYAATIRTTPASDPSANHKTRSPRSSDPAGMPFVITKIAPITKPVRPPLRPAARRSAASPVSANPAATEAATLSWTAVAIATDTQQASAEPAPHATRSRRMPRGTARAAFKPPKQAVTPISGAPVATPSASGAQLATAPASPARRSMPRRSTRNASVHTARAGPLAT